ncbi:IS6 family transposase [Pseudoteredinibacter isoporae]|uniref:IS6 family transposase n=1 Tax=Pseudoteredinibacter isoporae TaxID=570281 RepID=UPI00333FC7AD
MNTYKRFRYPKTIIIHAIWLYHRFTLSFRDIEETLAIRGVTVSYETIRQWCLKFAPYFVKTLKKKHGTHGNHWFLDEAFIKINGKPHYLWRAVDSDGSELDILITKRRNKYAATRFFKKLFKTQTQTTQKITTDRLASYRSALRDLGCKVQHSTA